MLAMVLGCRTDPLDAPYVNASTAAAAALAQYDTDKNNDLDAEELKQAPGIRAAITLGDTDKDGGLSKNELISRIKTMVGDEVGMMSLAARILYNGQPLEGAEVKFIPEPCLGPTFQPGSGKTNAQGIAAIKMNNEKFPGMQCGWFKVEVSKKDTSGKELVSEQYNAKTTLGAEVALDVPSLERGLIFELKSQSDGK